MPHPDGVGRRVRGLAWRALVTVLPLSLWIAKSARD